MADCPWPTCLFPGVPPLAPRVWHDACQGVAAAEALQARASREPAPDEKQSVEITFLKGAWWYTDNDYPDEGGIGPFEDWESAARHAAEGDYCIAAAGAKEFHLARTEPSPDLDRLSPVARRVVTKALAPTTEPESDAGARVTEATKGNHITITSTADMNPHTPAPDNVAFAKSFIEWLYCTSWTSPEFNRESAAGEIDELARRLTAREPTPDTDSLAVDEILRDVERLPSCEHCIGETRPGKRFCSPECEECELADIPEGQDGCANICGKGEPAPEEPQLCRTCVYRGISPAADAPSPICQNEDAPSYDQFVDISIDGCNHWEKAGDGEGSR